MGRLISQVKRIRGSGKNLRRLLLHPDFIVFIIITGIAFSIRLIYLYQIRAIPFFSAPLIDAQAYLVQAVKVSSGNLIGHEAFWQPPLYPYLLGWLVHLFGLNAFKIYLVQVAAGSLSAGLIYILGRNVFDRKVGALAGLAASLYGPFMFYEVQLLIPFLIVLLDLVLLILLLRYRQKGSLRHAAGSGLVLGLSAIARPNILLFGPAAAIWLLWTERGRLKVGPAFHRILAFFLACAAVVAVVTVRNYSVGGQFILISWNGGANFYLGNNRNWKETVSVRPGFAWDDLMDRPAHQGFLKETERSDYFYSKALDDIKDHPLWWMSLLGYKFYLFFHGHEFIRNLDIYMFRDYSPLLAFLVWEHGVSFPFGIVSALALLGMALAWSKRNSSARLLTAFILIYAFSIALFFVTGRYRIPAVPAMLVFAALSMMEIKNAISSRNKRQSLILLSALGTLLVLLNLPVPEKTPRDRVEEDYFLAQAYLYTKEYDRAEIYLRRVVKSEPDHLDALSGLGRIHYERGELDLAKESFTRLAGLAEGRSSRAAYNASLNSGIIMNDMGDYRGAISHLDEARKILPWKDSGPLIAGVKMADGDFEGAREDLERTLESNPDDVSANIELAMLFFRMRDMDAAMELLVKARDRWPVNAEVLRAWGEVYFFRGEFAKARHSFEKSLGLDPVQFMVWYKLGLVYQHNDRGERFGRGFEMAACLHAFYEAHRIKPAWALPILQTGHVLLAAGRIEQAAEKYQEALTLDPALEEARINLERIQQGRVSP